MEDNNARFLKACNRRCKKDIEQIIKDNDNINIYYKDPKLQKSIVEILCDFGPRATQISELIFSKEHFLNSVDSKTGRTPIFTAIALRNAPFVKLLLKHGASTDTLDKDGYNPFLFGCFCSNVDVVKLLLKHSDIDRKSSRALVTVASR